MSFEEYKEVSPNVLDWHFGTTYVYVVLREGTNVEEFNDKIADFKKIKNGELNRTLSTRPYSEAYLYDTYENGVQVGGRIEYVRLFSIIAIFILIIASINFMNLSTAKASRRLKEVGVKKTLGAGRKTLIFQYLGESLIMAKIAAGREREIIDQLQEFYQAYNPGFPFDYQFLDEDYQAQYVAEQRVSTLSKYFAGFAILISCLGLFGLAAFTAERRLKEIGIRKILGSSDFGIVRLLSADFIRMVFMAIVIALPISYFIAKSWLNDFAYRIELKWWFFIGAGLIALLIAWLSVGFQTIKAARVNPTQCLKDE